MTQHNRSLTNYPSGNVLELVGRGASAEGDMRTTLPKLTPEAPEKSRDSLVSGRLQEPGRPRLDRRRRDFKHAPSALSRRQDPVNFDARLRGLRVAVRRPANLEVLPFGNLDSRVECLLLDAGRAPGEQVRAFTARTETVPPRCPWRDQAGEGAGLRPLPLSSRPPRSL